MGPETIEFLVADALYKTKVFGFRKWAMRSSMFDHPLGQLRTNARQGFQIGSRRMIQVNPP
jgi:hypothetical protein